MPDLLVLSELWQAYTSPSSPPRERDYEHHTVDLHGLMILDMKHVELMYKIGPPY